MALLRSFSRWLMGAMRVRRLLSARSMQKLTRDGMIEEECCGCVASYEQSTPGGVARGTRKANNAPGD
jgi:hypothetical protein